MSSLNNFLSNMNKHKEYSNDTENFNYGIDKMEKFLNSKVVNKYCQPWRSLTTYLKLDRLKLYLDKQFEEGRIDDTKLIELYDVLYNKIERGQLKSSNLVYNETIGEIESIKEIE